MRWIREHKLISIILGMFLILAIILSYSIFSQGEGNFVTNITNKGVSTLSKGLSTVSTSVRNNIKGLFSYRELQEKIKVLENENQELEKKLAETKLNREELEELTELSEILNYDYATKKFDMISCDVISLDGSNWTNVFTINKGSEMGIEIGDAVINGSGLVGRIKDTGKGWSKVVSIIDDGSKVSFKLARDSKQLGIVSGNKDATISGFMLDAESTVSDGDIILTSGLGIYPEGLEIGNVKSITYNSNTLLKEIIVEPACSFRELNKVAVIR